jgi:hypothetical protein
MRRGIRIPAWYLLLVAVPVTARKDDAPAADQAAMTNVAGSMAFSGSG